MNRKQEQALLQQHRAQLQQRLEAETEPALVLSQAAPLLLAKVCRLLCKGLPAAFCCACVLPGSHVSDVCQGFRHDTELLSNSTSIVIYATPGSGLTVCV